MRATACMWIAAGPVHAAALAMWLSLGAPLRATGLCERTVARMRPGSVCVTHTAAGHAPRSTDRRRVAFADALNAGDGLSAAAAAAATTAVGIAAATTTASTGGMTVDGGTRPARVRYEDDGVVVYDSCDDGDADVAAASSAHEAPGPMADTEAMTATAAAAASDGDGDGDGDENARRPARQLRHNTRDACTAADICA